MPTTLLPVKNNRYPLGVVGESFYQDNLSEIAQCSPRKDEFRQDKYSAHLILEDNNRHDPGNAVRVEINGLVVGYLSRTNAAKYRRAISTFNTPASEYICNAAISGKRDTDDDPMLFGVWLSINLNNLQIDEHSPLSEAVSTTKTPISKNSNPPPTPYKSPSAEHSDRLFLIAMVLIAIVICFFLTMR